MAWAVLLYLLKIRIKKGFESVVKVVNGISKNLECCSVKDVVNLFPMVFAVSVSRFTSIFYHLMPISLDWPNTWLGLARQGLNILPRSPF
jgi:hypothetical protein